MWNNYVIEEDWDFGFIEVSTDGGTTWTEQKVYNEAGALVSTDDGYADPNGRMHDYGDKKYGLTGNSGGWRHDYVNLTRVRRADHAGCGSARRPTRRFLERGWFADDFSVTGGGATAWSDDVESGDDGWIATVGSFRRHHGRRLASSTPARRLKAQYYLAEWRNFDGFDKGLQYTYDIDLLHDAWKVEKIKYNAPGMLVWYRDTTYGNDNHVDRQRRPRCRASAPRAACCSSTRHFDPLPPAPGWRPTRIHRR